MKIKKIIFGIISFLICCYSFGQNPTYQQKLYYTCKVWGFVKYFHSEVSTCQVNWDSVLVANLPAIKNAVTQNDFNDALDTMLAAAGPMAIATTNPPAPLSPELRRNLNFNWINDPMLRNDVQVILDTIKNNFRPHAECWVQDNQYTNSYLGWLVFPEDNPILDSVITFNYPHEWNRILTFAKYWNIINYFNPYNYILDSPWDSTLFNFAVPLANAANDTSFYNSFRQVTSSLDDPHVDAFTYDYSYLRSPNDYRYGPKLVLRHIPGKYVVVKSAVTNISRGDEILTIDGLTTTQWEDSLRPYISCGDSDVFHRSVCYDMIFGPTNSLCTIVSKDSLGINHTIGALRNQYVNNSWFRYYPNDTLATTSWKMFGCNVGYVNMGQLQSSDVNLMYSDLQNASTIIFDIRNYPNGTIQAIANLLYAQSTLFSRFMTPDVTFPGTFYWYDDYFGMNGNTSAYQGKIILLMNEQTQSQAEFSCMSLEAMPNVVKVGSQTAGTDGNVTYFNLSQDIQTGFTSLGVYYPNGDSTERIGIVPDSLVYPTQAGIRHHRDEVLEKALEIAGCWLTVPAIQNENPTISVYPNPSTNVLHVDLNNFSQGKIIFEITDLTGRIVLQKEINSTEKNFSTDFDLHDFANGMYVLNVKTSTQNYSQKIIKE